MKLAEILVAEIAGSLETARQKSTAERTVGHEANAKLAASSENALFRVASPQRVLGLKSRNRMGRVGAADGLFTGFRKAEIPYLALLDEPRHGAHCFFDGRFGIDAVLVIEVDG